MALVTMISSGPVEVTLWPAEIEKQLADLAIAQSIQAITQCASQDDCSQSINGARMKHLVNALADLDAYGVAFVSLRDNLDLSTPSGRLMFQIIGAMAEFERSLIQERVRAGLRNASGSRGRRWDVRVALSAVTR
jgi:DNA invertase Pin-like site-specific DNA recombinase